MALTDRMLRAARLDAGLYEEVEADSTLTREAMTVVVLSAIGAGIGGARTGAGGLIVLTLVALIGWYVWAYLTYWIGTRLLSGPQTQADVGQLLRVLGYASAPGVVRVFGIIPGLSGLALAVGNIWMLVAMIVGVRQALDYQSTGRAIGVVLIGWLVYAIVMGLIFVVIRR
jgi:hypothetical protein